MDYSEKLKDPRWQKKRLEILERDEWQCQSCRNKENTLHVHHLLKMNNPNPWECKNEDLITLCESCHKAISVLNYNNIDTYIAKQTTECILRIENEKISKWFKENKNKKIF